MGWIKMRSDLGRDPAVVQLSETYGWEEHVIVGLLHKLWSWADEQLIDGNAVGVTQAFVNRYLGVPDFAQNLAQVGWLEINSDGIAFPKFDVHMSETAKRRGVTAVRVAQFKRKKGNGDSVTGALPREEKSKSKKKPSKESAPAPANGAPTPGELRFENFWQAYPKRNGVKRGKAKAKAGFLRLSVTDQEACVTSAPIYAEATESKFVSDAFRWIRDQLWDGYLEKPEPERSGPRLPTDEENANWRPYGDE